MVYYCLIKIRSKISISGELGAANEEVRSLRARENLLVSKKGFDGVCIELNAALEREQQAQKLLHEQNAKLQVSMTLFGIF